MGKAFLTGQSGIDTSDANAIASNILLNKTAYVDGVKVTGSYVEPTGYEGVAIMSQRYGSTNIAFTNTVFEWVFTFASPIDISKIKSRNAVICHDASTSPQYALIINSMTQESPTSVRINFTWANGGVNLRPYLYITGWRFTYV